MAGKRGQIVRLLHHDFLLSTAHCNATILISVFSVGDRLDVGISMRDGWIASVGGNHVLTMTGVVRWTAVVLLQSAVVEVTWRRPTAQQVR